MSFSNRVLLNRAAIAGLETIEVMMVVATNRLDQVTALVEQLGGRVHVIDALVGYVRATLPTERLTELAADSGIEAYQISSLSKGAWYRDAAPPVNAEMFRGFEVLAPTAGSTETRESGLPQLSVEASRQTGYTAADDVGLEEWIQQHPTFDGRGTTIALMEVGSMEFTHPILGTARTLDGREVPKLAGILNTIPLDRPDSTRAHLDTVIQAKTSWQQVGGRTYAMPRPGRYHFGTFTLNARANLLHHYGVLESDDTHEIWVDTDGDSDFRDETPIADISQRLDVRSLRLAYPKPGELSFVVARGNTPHIVHVYVAMSSHQTMTFSVAAASQTDDSLAFGAAPGARVLVVRAHSAGQELRDAIEGYLAVMKRPDVDVVTEAAGLALVPDTEADFLGRVFQRMVDAYRKPIFHSAGNWHLVISSVTLPGAFSTGGSLGPRTFAAWYGGGVLPQLMVHPISAAGPALDGALKPDFLAPMHRLAADLWSQAEETLMPRHAPLAHLPRGYQISCCTSASAPYAAGLAAVLLSAAKQAGVPYTLESVGRALRMGARFLPSSPAHQQGNGVLNVNDAWRELQHAVDIPRIRATSDVVHPLAQYSARGQEGPGLFERDGWNAGMTGRRTIRFVRETGPPSASYRVSWTGNDGTFAAQRSLSLPLGSPVSLPVTIDAKTPGAHSAILNLHDPVTNTIVFRTLATIVAAEAFERVSRPLRLTGAVSLMERKPHYVPVPKDVAAMSLELEVLRGSVAVTVVPSHGLFPNYYQHVYPNMGRTFTRGKYSLLLPHPAPGTWTFDVGNTSALLEQDQTLVSTERAEYALTVKLLSSSLQPRATGAGTIGVDVQVVGAALQEPVLEASAGTLRTHRGEFLPNGLPNQFDIDVPKSAASLMLHARGQGANNGGLELYLYDCTSGECFSHDFTLPAAPAQTLVVRNPNAGRWKAVVNAAPLPWTPGGFVLDEVVTRGVQRHAPSASGPRSPGMRWTERLTLPPFPDRQPGVVRVLTIELIDAAAHREALTRPWENRRNHPSLGDRTVAAGMALYRVD